MLFRCRWAWPTIASSILLNAPALAVQTAPVFSGTLSWIAAGVHATPTVDGQVNRDNALLGVPSYTLQTELRPNFKIVADDFQIVVRPRVETRYAAATGARGRQDARAATTSRINEGFVAWTIADDLSLTYGLQSYQWGAVESLSPSNRLFHETARQRDVLYEARGKNLARINLSAGKNLNTVFIGEVQDSRQTTDEAPFRAGEEWQSAGLAKSEYSWNDGADYAGLVLGSFADGQGWLGEYGSWSVPGVEGLSIFWDASHQRGSDAWYPSTVGPGTSSRPLAAPSAFAQIYKSSPKMFTLAASGAKYDFVNGTIVRGEYVYNQAGYSQDQRKAAIRTIAKGPLDNPSFAQDAEAFFAPGLELPGQRYAYASMHIRDIGGRLDTNFDIRSLYSLNDQTSLTYASLEARVGDHGTLIVAIASNGGRRDGELAGSDAPTEYLAYKLDL